MSTYGGDSWVPENIYRKRRVDELLGEAIEEDDMRRLSNGKLACLVCPNHPVLDTMPMVIEYRRPPPDGFLAVLPSTLANPAVNKNCKKSEKGAHYQIRVHRKGAGHQLAAERKREKDQRLREEIQKRIAQGSDAVSSIDRAPSNPPTGRGGLAKKKASPLLASTEAIKAAVLHGQDKAVLEAKRPRGTLSLDNEVKPYIRKASSTAMESQTKGIASSTSQLGSGLSQQTPQKSIPKMTPKPAPKSARRAHGETLVRSGPESADEMAMQELYKTRERELRLREAGWRRDGVGGWFRDENVEFDSDEEVPNNIKDAL